MRKLLARMDPGDWFVVLAGILVVTGLELAKPDNLFDRAGDWLQKVAAAPAPDESAAGDAPAEIPAKTPATAPVSAPADPAQVAIGPDGRPLRRIAAGEDPNAVCPAPAGEAEPLTALPAGARGVGYVTTDPATTLVAEMEAKALADGPIGALAVSGDGAWGRTFRFSSRPEAVRAALALCRLNGGQDCRVAYELLPDRAEGFDTCAWTLTAHQWGIKAGYDALAGTAALAVNRGGHAAFAEHADVNTAARMALRACIDGAEADPDGVDSPCFILRAKADGAPVAVEALKFRRMGESNWARAGAGGPAADAGVAAPAKPAPAGPAPADPSPAPRSLIYGQDPNALCPRVTGAGFGPRLLYGEVREVALPAAKGQEALVDLQAGAMAAVGAFSALAADGTGRSGLALGYASRAEAQRAANAICTASGGSGCKLLREVIPQSVGNYMTCDWTFPPALADAWAAFQRRENDGRTIVFAASRNGAYGIGDHAIANLAAEAALEACITSAAAKADGINSPCYVLAAHTKGGRIHISTLAIRVANEPAAP